MHGKMGNATCVPQHNPSRIYQGLDRVQEQADMQLLTSAQCQLIHERVTLLGEQQILLGQIADCVLHSPTSWSVYLPGTTFGLGKGQRYSDVQLALQSDLQLLVAVTLLVGH